MTTEVLGHTKGAGANELALHSMAVMEKFANGEVYNEAVWIERGRHAVQKTLEGMFELGRVLIVIKEHTPHGKFREIAEQEFGLHTREVTRLMNATLRFLDPKMKQAQPKLMNLGKSKLLELLVEEDDTLLELADGGDINGHTLDDIDRMTRNELRVALRENREQLAAKDQVISDKNKKIDEYAEKLAKKQKSAVKEPDPVDVANELNMSVSSKTVAIRSHLVQLGDYFGQLAAHGDAHGLSHQAAMVGAINQIMMDLNHLRNQFALPNDVPDSEVPEWLADGAPSESE